MSPRTRRRVPGPGAATPGRGRSSPDRGLHGRDRSCRGAVTAVVRGSTDATCSRCGPTVTDMTWIAPGYAQVVDVIRKEPVMPSKSSNVKNEKQYEALKDKGMSKERAAKIANSPGASSRGGKKSGSGGDSSQGGTTAQKKKAGRKGGKAAAAKKS